MPINKPGGEGNLLPPGFGQGLEPHRRQLVRRPVVRAALLGEPCRRALEHQSHRRRHGPEHRHLIGAHAARVDMRQQAGAVAHRGGRRARHNAACSQSRGSSSHCARRAIPQFGTLAEREQSLLAAELRALRGDRNRFLDRHVGTAQMPRRLGECAVMTRVAAQLGQGQKHFSRIGDERTEALIP